MQCAFSTNRNHMNRMKYDMSMIMDEWMDAWIVLARDIIFLVKSGKWLLRYWKKYLASFDVS